MIVGVSSLALTFSLFLSSLQKLAECLNDVEPDSTGMDRTKSLHVNAVI